jgi:uncharacterized protein YkwD
MWLRIITSLLAFTLVVLASCGGGGSTPLDINVPGGGDGGTSGIYIPPVTVPPVETYQSLGCWKASCFDTLPAGIYQNASMATWANDIFARANSARQQNGAVAMIRSAGLDRVAQAQARDMGLRNYFSHYTPEGVAPWERLQQAQLKDWNSLSARSLSDISFNGVGENAAKGDETAAEVVDNWMNSPGHRTNLLNTRYVYVGTGVYYSAAGGSMPITAVQLYVEKLP